MSFTKCRKDNKDSVRLKYFFKEVENYRKIFFLIYCRFIRF